MIVRFNLWFRWGSIGSAPTPPTPEQLELEYYRRYLLDTGTVVEDTTPFPVTAIETPSEELDYYRRYLLD